MRLVALLPFLLSLTLAAPVVPLNLEVGRDALRPSLALDAQGRPWVAWVEKVGAVYNGFVRRHNGQGWVRVGGTLNVEPTYDVAYVSLALEARGGAVVAWAEKPASQTGKVKGSGKLYVARWDGAAWRRVGPSLSQSDNTVADIPALRLDPSGSPLVVWSELPPDINADNVYMARWDGRKWQVIDRGTLTVDISSASRARDLAVDSRGRPWLAFSLHYYPRDFNVFAGPWNPQTGRWTRLGGSANRDPGRYAGAPAIALDSRDQPVVAMVEADQGFDLWVKRFDGRAWYALGKATLNNRSGGARSPKIAVGPGDNPVVAYADNLGSDRLFVKRWDGAAWVQLGEALNRGEKADVFSYELRLDASGNPAVAWAEQVGPTRRVFAARWDGQAWVGW